MRPLVDAITGLAWSIVSLLIVLTVVLLMLRRFVPVLGDILWRGYWRLLSWMFMMPARLVRLLIREVRRR